MIRSRLVNFLNRHTWIQYVILYIPVLLVGLYLIFYIADLSRIVAILNVNNQTTSQHINMGRVLRIDEYKSLEKGYELRVKGNEVRTVDADTGSTIYTVEKISDDDYAIWYSETEFIEVPSIEMLGVDADVVYVTLNEEGIYTIIAGDNVYNTDSIYNLSMIEKLQTGYRFEVTSDYIITVDNLDINFGSNLPTDDVYYNELTGSCIRNTNMDFARNFIVGSNHVMFTFSMLAYMVLLYIMYIQGGLVILNNWFLFRVNMLFVIALPFVGWLTYIVL